jgi:hypothetical protein
MNLLEETLSILKENNLTEEDVKWVGSNDIWFSWEDFKLLANINYDSGFGGEEIALDLLVVGKNWWLERHTYDGSEWWEFKQLPVKPKKEIKPLAITFKQAAEVNSTSFYPSLKKMNNIE